MANSSKAPERSGEKIMPKVSSFLWFEKEAEVAAKLYTSLIPNSRIEGTTALPVDSPSGPAGSVQLVSFTLDGQPYTAMNAGPLDPFNHAVSLVVSCDDQAELDRIWDGLLEGGGRPEQCGWLRDRWGLAWQIVPRVFPEMMKSPDRAAAKRVAEAMMKMVKFDTAVLQQAFDGK
jgi:predicted 3-demethylubiquinone-9 3-methyltransferase (glyoxalase superfamily)